MLAGKAEPGRRNVSHYWCSWSLGVTQTLRRPVRGHLFLTVLDGAIVRCDVPPTARTSGPRQQSSAHTQSGAARTSPILSDRTRCSLATVDHRDLGVAKKQKRSMPLGQLGGRQSSAGRDRPRVRASRNPEDRIPLLRCRNSMKMGIIGHQPEAGVGHSLSSLGGSDAGQPTPKGIQHET